MISLVLFGRGTSLHVQWLFPEATNLLLITKVDWKQASIMKISGCWLRTNPLNSLSSAIAVTHLNWSSKLQKCWPQQTEAAALAGTWEHTEECSKRNTETPTRKTQHRCAAIRPEAHTRQCRWSCTASPRFFRWHSCGGTWWSSGGTRPWPMRVPILHSQ